jgi:endonuclease/exonuclease/phosphatase (EEP) superfamily protein YafD
MKTISVIFATVAALLLALAAGHYATGFWLFFTFASLQIHMAAAAFVLCIASILFFRSWLNMVLAIAALALAGHGFLMLEEFRQPAVAAVGAKPSFRLLSINIMGNNLANGKRIADYVIASGADVVFIQESAPIGPEIPQLRAVYPYRLGCGAQTTTCDSSLWSKTPLLRGEVKTMSPIYRDRFMLATIEFDGKPISFVNVHLTKPYFDNFHEIELKKIAKAINAVEGPMVLAGDFNASILTPDIRDFLVRTRLMTAEWEPNTIPVEAPALGLAIDHIFVRDPLRITSLTREPDPLGSNHFGLSADVLLTDPSASYPQQ